MKEITSDMARENTDKNFRAVQRSFTKRIKEISKNGGSSATFNPEEYQRHLGPLIAWIKSLGFVCDKESDNCIRIFW